MFNKYPLYSQEGKADAKVICKFFNPYGIHTWYVLEAEKQENGDYLLFGLVQGHDVELGYFMLSDILNTKVKVWGCKLPLERDMYFENKTIKDAYKDCGRPDLYEAIYKKDVA